MGMNDMSEGEADYLKYRFKQYLGSVSREIQNRRLDHMGMTIDKAIDIMERYEMYGFFSQRDGRNKAIDTMRKYQKIKEIIKEWGDSGLLQNQLYDKLQEVIEDEIS